ncbi:nitroreductase [Aquimarina sp. MAR_2010_214]|uniref:nitroreductase family protein n=1 Tax=Aquimarina sp. MAR_2010_214 TaxID=1250026 RepID=UPI000C70B3C2|nr:nitroreductase family protein [Aquimarina sp. MAR_2010_214]PKV50977.1 nitroreductase [Aquimarina sp. MAR_2010_214]
MFARLKSKLHAVIFWQTSLGDIANKIYDLKIFYKYYFRNDKFKSRKSERAFLTKQYHIVEKGLALPNPRMGFGEKKIQLLLDKTSNYIKQYGEDELTSSIKNCLSEYIEFNKNNNVDLDNNFFNRVIEFISNSSSKNDGGTKMISKMELEESINIDFESFVKSRFSVRNFDNKDVDIQTIERAVDIAKHAPSVCNRQSWMAHIFTKKGQILELLKLQGGNNGFTDSVNRLVIITTDTKAFTTLESNQVYVDGGLFSMNLVLSFHNQGLGACCLNTCFPYTTEKKVKKVGDIPENEKLIMMIGIGNLKKEYKVAVSKKKNLSEVIKIH